MKRFLRLLLPLSLTALGCSRSITLALLVTPPSGAPPQSTEVRVYNRYGMLAAQRYSDALPLGLQLTAFPSVADELRVIAVGYDGTTITSLAGSSVMTPLSASVRIQEALSRSFADQDGDGVPDSLDNCPTVANADQKSAAGGIGDACREMPDMAQPATPDLLAAPSPDLGPDLGTPPCPTDSLCDNFDAPAIDTTKWTVSCPTGVTDCVSIDQTTFNRGKGSLHVKLGTIAPNTLQAAVVTETATFPAPVFMHVRAFIYVPSSFSPEPAAIMEAEQAASPFSGVSLQLAQGGFSMFQGFPAPGMTIPPAGSVPRNTWVCVEWDVHVGKTGYVRLSVGGSVLSSPAINGDITSTPPLGELALGLVSQAGSTAVAPRELWIDDLVVSPSAVGCK
jgi:hypothetical protein